MTMNDDIQILENGVCYLLDNESHTASVVASADGKYKGNVVIAPQVCYGGETFIVTHIAKNAFAQCEELLSVGIPDSIDSIGWEAFCDCTGLTSIIIPDSVTTIEQRAFNGCINLASFAIPVGLTQIGEDTFHNTAWYNSQPDGLIYINKVLYTCKGRMPSDVTIAIKQGTTHIGDGAFAYQDEITSVTIPSSVTSIGKYAFAFCRALTSITIPEGITTIEEFAFLTCTGLIAITLPKTITHIKEESSLCLCDDLQTIYIPKGMTDHFCQIGLSAYRNKLVEM